MEGAQAALMTYNNLRLLPLALASSFVDPLAVMVRAGGVRDAFGAYRDALRALRNVGGNDELRKFAELYGYIEREGMGDVLAPLYGGTYDPDSRLGKINSALFRYNGLEAMTRFHPSGGAGRRSPVPDPPRVQPGCEQRSVPARAGPDRQGHSADQERQVRGPDAEGPGGPAAVRG
jgi:hypothetical protein